MIDWRDDRGVSGTLELMLGVGLLMFPIVMMVASIPTWIEAKSMGELAAQEAARALVLADTPEEGMEAGRAAANQVAANHGYEGVEVTFTGTLDWGQAITATVTVQVPAVDVPGIGSFAATTVSFSHTERVEDFRSFPP